MSQNRIVVFTDLDGTLLDHDSYQYTPAMPALRLLEERGIPLIMVSSKTAAELKELRQHLNLSHPFIVENGAALYLPKSDFKKPVNSHEDDDCWVIGFSWSRSYWCLQLAEMAALLPGCFTRFSVMGIGEIARVTGLSIPKAALANKREYSEPVWFFGKTEEKVKFRELAKERGATILEGGRFWHLTNGFDKGDAVKWLLSYFGANESDMHIFSVALGDSHNDLGMLKVVDYPVLVKSPVHDFPEFEAPNLMTTGQFGPNGWNEALHQLIPELLNNTTVRGN